MFYSISYRTILYQQTLLNGTAIFRLPIALYFFILMEKNVENSYHLE